MMQTLAKEQFIKKLRNIKKFGWVKNARPGNSGGVGNTLEDLLGIKENNLPIPNAREWELKCQRASSQSLTTLFHMEPSPRVMKFVPSIFLPKYGWKHEEAGKKYPKSEMSFRQTINCLSRSDRGFRVVIDTKSEKVLISFDAKSVSPKHAAWLGEVKRRVGLSELNPQPYWGFKDLRPHAETKLLNCFFVIADTRRESKNEYFSYQKIFILKNFSFDKFIGAMEKGFVLVDFDARTGHNHGTKFRMRQDKLPELYESVEEVK